MFCSLVLRGVLLSQQNTFRSVKYTGSRWQTSNHCQSYPIIRLYHHTIGKVHTTFPSCSIRGGYFFPNFGPQNNSDDVIDDVIQYSCKFFQKFHNHILITFPPGFALNISLQGAILKYTPSLTKVPPPIPTKG